MLEASGAHIGGRVDLSRVRGIDPAETDDPGNYGQCWVKLVTAKIADLVVAPFARFVAPPKRADFVAMSRFANYALDLRAADIDSSVILRPGCSAVGGISLALSNIDGSLWACGAKVTADEEYAFSADYAVVRGSIYLRPYDPPSQKEATDKTAADAGYERDRVDKFGVAGPGGGRAFPRMGKRKSVRLQTGWLTLYGRGKNRAWGAQFAAAIPG